MLTNLGVTARRAAEKSVEKTVQGVRYALRDGQYYFSLGDVARKLGYRTIEDAKKLCRHLDKGINLSNGKQAITFDDFLLLSKGAKEIPDDFINALQKEVSLNRKENQDRGNHPDFSNPAEAARAWAEIYEQRESLQSRLNVALEKLGDGKDYKIVNAIPWIKDYFKPVKIVPMLVGFHLSRESRKQNKPVRKCMAFGYRVSTSIGMYSVDIIDTFKAKLDDDPEFMKAYRKVNKDRKA